VTRLKAILSHHKASYLNMLRFNVLLTDTIVPNERIGRDYNLPSVGGVGEHLLVASHTSVKHHLTIGGGLCPKGVALID
jgi:hypothetical protein